MQWDGLASGDYSLFHFPSCFPNTTSQKRTWKESICCWLKEKKKPFIKMFLFVFISSFPHPSPNFPHIWIIICCQICLLIYNIWRTSRCTVQRLKYKLIEKIIREAVSYFSKPYFCSPFVWVLSCLFVSYYCRNFQWQNWKLYTKYLQRHMHTV